MKFKIIPILLSSTLLFSCVSGLNANQKSKLNDLKNQNEGHYIQEKKPGAAVALGFLPGGGSFYTRHPLVGVLDLLTWPLSILWDPINGYNGAQEINYYASLKHLKETKKRELDELEDKFISKSISENKYLLEKHRIERKYDPDYIM